MATITPTAAGANLATQAAAGPDKYRNTGNERLWVDNGNGASCVITFTSVAACNQGFTHNTTKTVPAGQKVLLPSVDPARYNDTNGDVTISYSVTASVLVGVLQTG